ncbi:phasin family protein [Alloalcanivorax marinus]|uniref:phasin family protein n=1 Tax=Alloalcanivorax marinus TaxID=1177169 RepID=UPI0019349CFB|nr:phasin family protein [Alloalcanivorax marinus]MBL7252298.1 phasin family protein [Alloalcanivorax marinus]
MGELKDLREDQEKLLSRVRSFGDKLYLAGLGAYSKAGDSSEELYEQYVEAGSEAYGDDAEGKSKLLLAGRGFTVRARALLEEAPRKRQELYEQFISTGKEARGEKAETSNEFVLAGLGALTTAREQSRKLFEELVSAGEKQRA